MRTINMDYRLADKFHRHLRIVARHLTLKRLVNVVLSCCSYALRLPISPAKPFLLKIEPSGFCNLRCDGCRSGKKVLTNFDEGLMSLETFDATIKQMARNLIEVGLYLWGEPLANKKIDKMISLLRSYNIGSVISTNMHYMNEKLAKGILNAGLDKLIVAIDGMSQEAYGQVRIGGNLEKVMNNLTLFMDLRNNGGYKNTLVEWQYIKTDFNKHEIGKAQQLARNLQIDCFTLLPDWSRRESDQKTKNLRAKAHRSRTKGCPWLWFALAVQWDGNIYPCCHVAHKKNDAFSNITQISLNNLWNSEIYRDSRRKFAFRKEKTKTTDSVCHRCPL